MQRAHPPTPRGILPLLDNEELLLSVQNEACNTNLPSGSGNSRLGYVGRHGAPVKVSWGSEATWRAYLMRCVGRHLVLLLLWQPALEDAEASLCMVELKPMLGGDACECRGFDGQSKHGALPSICLPRRDGRSNA
jgi:hypothetical protein